MNALTTSTPVDLAAISAWGIIPVVVLERASDADPLGHALAAGGLPVAEVTLRTSAAIESISILAKRGDVIVGAGTVTTARQADQAIEAGATLVVSPGLSESVVRRCQERQIAVLPGAVTATEVMKALDLGLTAVKFFPAETSGGASAIKALAAPFGGVTFVPTGGIGLKNVDQYLSLGCVPAVGGSWMVPAELVSQGEFSTVERLAREAAEFARTLK